MRLTAHCTPSLPITPLSVRRLPMPLPTTMPRSLPSTPRLLPHTSLLVAMPERLSAAAADEAEVPTACRTSCPTEFPPPPPMRLAVSGRNHMGCRTSLMPPSSSISSPFSLPLSMRPSRIQPLSPPHLFPCCQPLASSPPPSAHQGHPCHSPAWHPGSIPAPPIHQHSDNTVINILEAPR